MATYATDLIIAIHNTVVSELGGGADLVLTNSGNTVLAIFPLGSDAGTVDPVTGQLSINFDGRCEAAEASGTAAYFKLRKADTTVLITGPVRSGTSSLTGYLTLNSTLIESGSPIEITSLTFG